MNTTTSGSALGPLLHTVEDLHNWLVHSWESEAVEGFLAWTLVFVFLAGLAGIWLKSYGLLPPEVAELTPHSAFEAVNLAFTVLLVYEIMALILSLARSVSISLGKQFEVLCLILIRQSFKGLAAFGYPFTLDGNTVPLLHILTNGVGALVIFVLLGIYYRLQRHKCMIRTEHNIRQFIALKKFISLLLLCSFVIHVGPSLLEELHGTHAAYTFFARFYTILIFSDILIMLVALRYQPGFPFLFRNSGYALATLLIRLSLVAGPFWDAGLGLASIVFAICLTLAFNSYTSDKDVEGEATVACPIPEATPGKPPSSKHF